jgi:hypothetical protein
VYEEYLGYCATNNVKPLSTADFGKVMKQVYPQVSPRYFTSCYRYQYTSVAVLDPGSGAFLTPGSGIGKKSGS